MQKNGLTHILFLATIAELGGAQRYIYDLASNLFAPAFAVTVAAGGDGPLFSTLAQRNIATQTLRHLRRAISPLHDLAAIFEIRRLLKRLKPDILQFIGSRMGQDRCLWGTNGLPWKENLDQVDQIGLKDQAKRLLLRENAIRLFNL